MVTKETSKWPDVASFSGQIKASICFSPCVIHVTKLKLKYAKHTYEKGGIQTYIHIHSKIC